MESSLHWGAPPPTPPAELQLGVSWLSQPPDPPPPSSSLPAEAAGSLVGTVPGAPPMGLDADGPPWAVLPGGSAGQREHSWSQKAKRAGWLPRWHCPPPHPQLKSLCHQTVVSVVRSQSLCSQSAYFAPCRIRDFFPQLRPRFPGFASDVAHMLPAS